MKEGEPQGEPIKDLHREEKKQQFNYKRIAVFLLAFFPSYFVLGEQTVNKKTYEKGQSIVNDITYCLDNPENELCRGEFEGKDVVKMVERIKGLPEETLGYLQKAVESLSKEEEK